jgi:penicillin-binding protein 1B
MHKAERYSSTAVSNGQVTSITDDRGQSLTSYELEPLLITGLSEDASRSKRRLMTYDEIPSNLVQAVVAIEDRRFFEHGGVNFWRLFVAGVRDVTTGQKQQGGSTLTMQLARGFFLSPEKHFKRKLIEIAISFHLEHRFNKQQIFEMYANQINLGQRGSFSIDGFGEASQAYLGKDVRQLDLAECALLAGMIQRPNYFSPFRHPDRAIERRNLVLDSMVETGAITKDAAERAKSEQLHLSAASVDASEAPYFVDLVHEQLMQKACASIPRSIPICRRWQPRRSLPPSTSSTSRSTSCTRARKSSARATPILRWPSWRSTPTPARCWRWSEDAVTALRS